MGMLIKYGAGGEHEFGAEFEDMDLPSRQEALAELTRRIAGVHGLAKRVPPEMFYVKLNIIEGEQKPLHDLQLPVI